MAEGEQPGLTEQDIEGEREDHVDADEAHRRQRKPRAKDERREREHGRGGEPRRENMNGPGHDFARSHQARRSEYEHQNEKCVGNDRRQLRDRNRPQIAEERRRSRSEDLAERQIDRHRQRLNDPHQQRRDKGAGQGAHAADDHHHEQDRTEIAGHRRLRHERRSGDGARQAREPAADAEDGHEHARHVMAEHGDHVRMRECGANNQADASALKNCDQEHEDRGRGQQDEHLVGWIVGSEHLEGDEVERLRDAIVGRRLAPEHFDQLFDDEGEAESEQQF